MTSPQPDPWVPGWSLGDRLRRIRRELGYAQEELADRLGVSSSTLAAWETGRNKPDDPVYLAQKIEILLGVPAQWTLGLMDPPQAVVEHPSTAPMMRVMPHPSEVRSSPRPVRPKRSA